MSIFAILLGTFLAGSIPSGVLLARAFGLPDPRSFGSGNIGASNLSRLGGKKLGVLTFTCDFLKGFIPVILSLLFLGNNNLIIPFVIVLTVFGHCYSIFLAFDGGKGVATTAGALFAIQPIATLIGLCVWVLVFLLEKTSSLAAMVALIAILAALGATSAGALTLLAASVCCLIVIRRHDTNLVDLINASERSFDKEVATTVAK